MIFSEGIIFKNFKFWRRSFLSKKKAFLAFTQGGALPDMSSTAQCRQIHVCRLQTRQTFWSSRPGGEILDPGVLKSCSHPRVLSFALPARVGVQVTGSLSRPAEHNIPRFGHPGARDRLFNHVRLGIKEERCIAAFSDQNQSTQRPKDYNIWANRGHPCFYKNEMALLVTFCIQIPI